MTTWVGTSWKMTKTIAGARAYAATLAAARDVFVAAHPSVRSFVIPPLTALSAVRAELGHDGPVLLGVQNAHWEDSGAWTGETSVPQALDAGARLVEIGHSERRRHFGETDGTVRAKVAAATRHGAIPLVCVGETHEERRAGRALDVVLRQVDAALAGRADWGSCAGRQAPPPETPLLVAYEPVWAIGEAGREPRAEELVEVTSRLAATPGVDAVLYGGSVHPRNARELLDVDGVDGLFVGRGAWDVRDFLEIVRLAAVREGHVTDAATPFTQPIAH